MKSVFRWFLAAILLLCSFQFISAKESFGFYYGDQYLPDTMAQFEFLVINPESFSRPELYNLRQAGVKLIAYMSIGEIRELIPGEGPGGFASWYMDRDNDGFPDKNLTWNSYYVNAADPAWREYVLNTIIPGKLPYMTGFFMDTVDTAEKFPDTKAGMTSLIAAIRQTYPELFLVQNRGFSLLEESGRYIDAVLFESFSVRYDWTTDTYLPWEGDDLKYTDQAARELNRQRRVNPFEVWTLDYIAEGDTELLAYILERAARYHFKAATSDVFLRRLDQLNLDSIQYPNNSPLKSFYMQEWKGSLQYKLVASSNLDMREYYTQLYFRSGDKNPSLFQLNPGFQADLMMENGNLYRYSGDGSSWEWIFVKRFVENKKSYLYQIGLKPEDIGYRENTLLECVAVLLDYSWNPVLTTPVLRHITPLSSYQTADETDLQIAGALDITGLNVTVDSTQITTAILLREEADLNNHYTILIDSDAPDKGYTFMDITASFMIKDGALYAYTGDGSTYTWEYRQGIFMESQEQSVSFTLEKESIGLSEAAFEMIAITESSSWSTTDLSATLQGFGKGDF